MSNIELVCQRFIKYTLSKSKEYHRIIYYSILKLFFEYYNDIINKFCHLFLEFDPYILDRDIDIPYWNIIDRYIKIIFIDIYKFYKLQIRINVDHFLELSKFKKKYYDFINSNGFNYIDYPIKKIYMIYNGNFNNTITNYEMLKISSILQYNECCICYDHLDFSNSTNTYCGHCFHDTCFNNWIESSIERQIKLMCPICRKLINT